MSEHQLIKSMIALPLGAAMGSMITTYVLTNDDVNEPFSIGVTSTSYFIMTKPLYKHVRIDVGWAYLLDGIEITTMLIIQWNNKIYTKISTHPF